MSMRTNHFDGESTETALARVLTSPGMTESLYVEIPTIGRSRRTDGGAEDMYSGSVEYEGGYQNYGRGDYVMLTFEPTTYGDDHVLTRVEPATFTEPPANDEPTFPNTESDIPTTCPKCGREAAAIVVSEYDTDTGGVASENADMCRIDPENRGSWFGFSRERVFVHGTL